MALLKITTGASLFEDSFEILTNSQRSRFAYLACLPALWLGKLRQMKGIEAWKSATAVCEAAGNEPVYAQVDGEPIGPAPISFRIVPNALSLVTPATTAACLPPTSGRHWNHFSTRVSGASLCHRPGGEKTRLPRFGTAVLVAAGVAPDLDYAGYFAGASADI